MPRLSSWGLVLTRAHQQEASFHLKLSLEKQGPWGGSGRAASPVPVLWRRRRPSQVDHVLGVTYHLQLTLQGCRPSTVTEPDGSAGARGATAVDSQGPLRLDSGWQGAGSLFVKQ